MQDDAQDQQLISQWQRSDWRESLFAPNVTILQALTKSGATASGFGTRREDAYERCLSETAEILAKAALASGLTGQPGIAAHRTSDGAKLNALFEAQERISIWQWWQGQLPALQIPDPWLILHGIADLIAHARAGAAIKRTTGLWLLQPNSGLSVVICKSQYAEGQDPILGYGASACPVEAAAKALREALLMEVNLMEVMAARSGHSPLDVTRIEAKITRYQTRVPSILKDAPAPATMPNRVEMDPEIILHHHAPQAEWRDITPPGQLRPVWQCSLPGTHRLGANTPSGPFL